MRIFLILLNLFLTSTSIGYAVSPNSGQVENIQLNIKDHEMAVTFLGLSEGEATLLQGPDNENILVNTGGKNTEDELEGLLDLYHVKRLHALILTRNRAEVSASQINKLVSKYNIKEIITTQKQAKQLANKIAAEITVTDWKEGIKAGILPEVSAIVQYAGTEADEGIDFMLEFYKHRIFLMSSYSSRAEQVLLKKNLEDVHVFKLPIYAKEESLSESFIHYLNPQISILSAAGEHQPNPDVLYDLHDAWSEIYSTKRYGTITIKFTKTKYEIIPIPTDEELGSK